MLLDIVWITHSAPEPGQFFLWDTWGDIGAGSYDMPLPALNHCSHITTVYGRDGAADLSIVTHSSLS
jgi:hypothetical protein